jgi:RNA polymerase sigma-70 factor (ECF subfamily)
MALDTEVNCKKFVTTIDTARILEDMTEFFDPKSLHNEDSLESLLDEESDEEFGLPKFQEHFADSLTPAVLKDWSAKDFASIYVRFRPHLERHAKRFLNNSSQVEEVVQDAFLYLMTTLPELDSELGVLRFLKWKTRLLALDVIRANSRVSLAPLDEHGEFEANIPEISQDLERADDAAIVSLALAKLQPRHREALIATLYEEKSAQVVSAQMGLSENAFRQLMFRSRAAFKKALIGEAETAGLSMSGILSVAARKAAADSGKIASVAGAFLLVLAVSIGVIPNLASTTSEEIVSQPVVIAQDPATPSPADSSATSPLAPAESDAEAPSEEPQPIALEAGRPAAELVADEPENQSGADNLDTGTQLAVPAINPIDTSSDVPSEESIQRGLVVGSLQQTLSDSAASSLASASGESSAYLASSGVVELSTGSGLTGRLTFDASSKSGIESAWFKISVDGKDFISVPNVSFSQATTRLDGTILIEYIATDLLIGDASGEFDFVAINDTVVSRSALRVDLLLSPTGQLMSSSISLAPRA